MDEVIALLKDIKGLLERWDKDGLPRSHELFDNVCAESQTDCKIEALSAVVGPYKVGDKIRSRVTYTPYYNVGDEGVIRELSGYELFVDFSAYQIANSVPYHEGCWWIGIDNCEAAE